MDIRKICIGCMHEIDGKEKLRFCTNCGYDLGNTTAAQHRLQPYTVLNEKYLVGKVLDQDNASITYLGINLSAERIVFIKEFYPNGFVTRNTNISREISLDPQASITNYENLKNKFYSEAENYIEIITENNTSYIILDHPDNENTADVVDVQSPVQQMQSQQGFVNQAPVQQMQPQQSFVNQAPVQQQQPQQGFVNQSPVQQIQPQQGFVNQTPMQQMQQQQPQQGFVNQPVPENKPKKKKGGKVAIVFIVLLLIAGIAGAAIYFVKPEIVTELASNMGIELGANDKDENEPTSETSKADETAEDEGTVTEETAAEETTVIEDGLSEEELEKLAALSEQAAQDKSVANLKDVLNQYYNMSTEHELSEDAITNIQTIFADYQNGTIEHVAMLNEQEVYPAMYIQMKLELEEAIELSKKYSENGIEIDCKQVETELASKGADYKQRLINNFDNLASEQINTNGVISRSALWPLMERADETGLIDETNADDELRQRYITALTYHIDSELDSLDKEQAIAKIYEVLESTDYNPLLVYYLSNNGDENGKTWYTEINNILKNHGYNFDGMDLNAKRNFIFDYVKYTEAREEIRTYMGENFKGQQ